LKWSAKYILATFAAVLAVVTLLIAQRNYFHEKLSDYTIVNDGVVVCCGHQEVQR